MLHTTGLFSDIPVDEDGLLLSICEVATSQRLSQCRDGRTTSSSPHSCHQLTQSQAVIDNNVIVKVL